MQVSDASEKISQAGTRDSVPAGLLWRGQEQRRLAERSLVALDITTCAHRTLSQSAGGSGGLHLREPCQSDSHPPWTRAHGNGARFGWVPEVQPQLRIWLPSGPDESGSGPATLSVRVLLGNLHASTYTRVQRLILKTPPNCHCVTNNHIADTARCQ
jgi:hypothetical protein